MNEIYLVQEDGRLVTMSEQEYDSEAMLQKLLERYSDLLAGDQISPAEPRRWALVSREMPLASEEDGSSRWSVDHLFLDQDGIPTIVEVKRSSDTRIRREVVGQMLDYAANAVYWSVETIRAKFKEGRENPEDELASLLGAETDYDAFWQSVKTNLQAGRVRMIFVADAIPSELRRIVEFLNTQMDPAEVLACEIKQYLGKSQKALVPRILGQTAQAQQKKAIARQGRQWDEPSFFAALEERRGTAEADAARKILTWAKNRQLRIWWGKGKQSGSFFPLIDHGEDSQLLLAVWTNGGVEIQFQHMLKKPPFDNKELRIALLEKLNAISGVSFPPDAIERRPSFGLKVLTTKESLGQFIEVLDWAVEQVKNC